MKKHDLWWIKPVLIAAGIYDLAWGAITILFPSLWFQWAGMEACNYPSLWQGIGMMVAVYGIGYIITAFDPFRYWPIVLVGFLGKIFGPLGFVMSAMQGEMAWAFGWQVLINDLIWWIPLGIILLKAFEANFTTETGDGEIPFCQTLLELFRDQNLRSLWELSHRSPVLVLFLRHAGCTFCREALADIQSKREPIQAANTHIAIVHMSTDDSAQAFCSRYGLDDASRFSDPEKKLYRAFGLQKGKLSQLLGWKVWWRGFEACILSGHGVGKLEGDGFQMPGVFVLYKGEIIKSFRHNSPADRPDYEEMVCSI